MVEDDLGLLVDRDDDEDQFEINEVGHNHVDVFACPCIKYFLIRIKLFTIRRPHCMYLLNLKHTFVQLISWSIK